MYYWLKVEWTAGVIDILRKIELPKNHKNMKLHYLKHDLITLLLLQVETLWLF